MGMCGTAAWAVPPSACLRSVGGTADAGADRPRGWRWNADVARLAAALEATCAQHGLPPPCRALPSRATLRRANPTLANRIESMRGRDGYARLAAHVGAPLPPRSARPRCTPPALRPAAGYAPLLAALAPHSPHPRVIPGPTGLPRTLRDAIRRHGGARRLAHQTGMLRETEWRFMQRYADFAFRLIVVIYGENPPPLSKRIETEVEHPLEFPSSTTLAAAGLYNSLQGYGGRKAFGARLGFKSLRGGLFMGRFSPSLAAELLEYAVCVGQSAPDGYVAMPSETRMRDDGRGDLADWCRELDGHVECARRVGLVPLEQDIVPQVPKWAPVFVDSPANMDDDECQPVRKVLKLGEKSSKAIGVQRTFGGVPAVQGGIRASSSAVNSGPSVGSRA